MKGQIGKRDEGTGGAPYTIGGKKIATIYANDADQTGIGTALDRIFGTRSGSEYIDAASKSPFEVRTALGLRDAYRVGNTIYLGTNSPPLSYQTVLTEKYFFGLLSRSVWMPVTTERLLAHEIGHIYGATWPLRVSEMDVVRSYENPIMRELGEVDRACYPCLR